MDIINKHRIEIPKGIRYLSDWEGYTLKDYSFPHILDKGLTGCGFTSYCLSSSEDVILVSPRKMLLENKEQQIPGVYYAKNSTEISIDYEKNLVGNVKPVTGKKEKQPTDDPDYYKKIQDFKDNVNHYYLECRLTRRPCKILVTYDSFRHVKDALGIAINEFYIVVDEFQSIFIDAKFKSTTEIELLGQLVGIEKICFASATPTLDEYLVMLDEFKDLPYYCMDWKSLDPDRVIKPNIELKISSNVTGEASNIIKLYLEKGCDITDPFRFNNERGELCEIYSTEAVLYFNSVKAICSLIKKHGLTPENTNVLCARTEENAKLLRRAFGMNKSTLPAPIGNIPLEGEVHKMFTFCTRTVYLGADFYSKCAKTYIFSDANIDSLVVDISMDLDQIIGRQRLNENPWKNYAKVFAKPIGEYKSKEDFLRHLEEKKGKTNDLLLSYSTTPTPKAKETLAEKYEKDAKNSNYKDDYVAVNKHSGSSKLPVFNNLVMISELRTFEVQQTEYKDRFSIFASTFNEGNNVSEDRMDVLVRKFKSLSTFPEKMKMVMDLDDAIAIKFVEYIPLKFKNYYTTLSRSQITRGGYKEAEIKKYVENIFKNQESEDEVISEIYSEFKVGERYLKSDIKEKLLEIYTKHDFRIGCDSRKIIAKASDLENWFEIKRTKKTLSGKRVECFEILAKK